MFDQLHPSKLTVGVDYWLITILKMRYCLGEVSVSSPDNVSGWVDSWILPWGSSFHGLTSLNAKYVAKTILQRTWSCYSYRWSHKLPKYLYFIVMRCVGQKLYHSERTIFHLCPYPCVSYNNHQFPYAKSYVECVAWIHVCNLRNFWTPPDWLSKCSTVEVIIIHRS